MQNPYVLVTGGAGYIGSHTVKRLQARGYRPVVIDNLIYGHEWALHDCPLHVGDLRDRMFVDTVLRTYDFKAVFHFAAFAYVGESVRDPLKYYDNNVTGTLALLQALEKTQITKFVFSSTCATYGEPERMPIDESFPQNPVNPYGASKLMIERVLADVARARDFHAVALRYFNASGADSEALIGEDHDPETHLIPLALQAAYRDASLTVFGDDYPTPDGTCIRDYIHVNDLADAHIQALEWMNDRPGFSRGLEAFNLGTGKGFSVMEIVSMVEKVTGRKPKFRMGARREGDPPRLVATAEKARQQLGWQPRESDLENIVRTADRWYRRHFLKEDR